MDADLQWMLDHLQYHLDEAHKELIQLQAREEAYSIMLAALETRLKDSARAAAKLEENQ